MSTPPVPVVNALATVDARYQHAMEELCGRVNYERAPDSARSLADFRLTKMREILGSLGNPQLSVPTVHIAGSKGKGSTATMVARIAQAAGYRVGLFTSPHVEKFEERFTINGIPPDRQQVVDLYDELKRVLGPLRDQGSITAPTFFELATAMCWMLFQRERVDLAVMEVGLGGRLDSTNVCQPIVTAITSISRDHTRLLGETLGLIAREKAGIIKPGIPVITNVPEAEPAQVIEEVAQQENAPLYRLGKEFDCQFSAEAPRGTAEPSCVPFEFQGFGERIQNLQAAMPGVHQVRNGALATAIALQLRQHGFTITEEAIRTGIGSAKCRLRIEVFRHSPLLIVDAAHNPASISALCETLRNVQADRRIAVFASSRDKEAELLLQIMNQSFDKIVLTRFLNNPRAFELHELQGMAERVLTRPWQLCESPREALLQATGESHPGDLICVTGSFFLAAEVQDLLQAGAV